MTVIISAEPQARKRGEARAAPRHLNYSIATRAGIVAQAAGQEDSDHLAGVIWSSASSVLDF